LEKKGRFQLCIWPEHALIGTHGHSINSSVNDALQEWCGVTLNTVQYIMKGTNCLVEMYSAICAEVEIKTDPSTSVDELLIERLNEADKLIICGQALSHCLNYTARDILKYWTKEPSRLCILIDCSSSVPGFEEDGEKFIRDMKAAGCTMTTSLDVLKV